MKRCSIAENTHVLYYYDIDMTLRLCFYLEKKKIAVDCYCLYTSKKLLNQYTSNLYQHLYQVLIFNLLFVKGLVPFKIMQRAVLLTWIGPYDKLLQYQY